MKTKLKTAKALGIAFGMMLAMPAFAGGVGSIDFGITNATLAGSSTITALGGSIVSCDQQERVTLVYTGTAITTNAATSSLVLARVDGNLNIETTPLTTNTVNLAASGTNAFVAFIDVPSTVLNSSYGLSLLSISNNTGVVSISGPALKVWKKRLQAPN